MRTMLLFLLVTCVPTLATANQDLLESALKQYNTSLSVKGEQKEEALLSAASSLEKYIQMTNCRNSHLEYNIGTAYLLTEMYGHSILHLKKALALSSNDERIVTNLFRAGQLARVDLYPTNTKTFTELTTDFWKSLKPLFLQILLIFTSILMTIWMWISRRALSFVKIGFIIICMVTVGSATYLRSSGVFVPVEAVLLQDYNPRRGMGDHEKGVMTQELTAGSSGRVLRNDMGWLEVEWNNAVRGWVPNREHLVGLVE